MRDILFLAHRVPFPPDRGDKIRGFHILRHLAERARVHLVAFADTPGDMAPAEGLTRLLASCVIVPRLKSTIVAGAEALVSGKPLSLSAFASKPMREAVETVLARRPIDGLYIFSSQMAQYVPKVTAARVVMDFVDMDSAKFAAYA